MTQSSTVWWVVGGCLFVGLAGLCVVGIAAYLFLRASDAPMTTGPIPSGPDLPTPGIPVPGVPTPALPTQPPGTLVQQVPATPRPSNLAPRTLVGAVSSSTLASVPPGQTCSFAVRIGEDTRGGYNCQTQVMCGTAFLYGNGTTSGFFPCAVYDFPPAIVGLDSQTTGVDTDGSFELDTRQGRFIVRDDANGANGAFEIHGTISILQ